MNTPPDIVRAAYVDLVVTDLAKARAWWVDLIGFHVQDERPGALYLRGCEEFIHHSVVLREGPQAACERMGFRVRTPEDVDRAERYFSTRLFDLPGRELQTIRAPVLPSLVIAPVSKGCFAS